MTVVDFCRSKQGTGINQSKLYRKLRRFVEEHATADFYRSGQRFEDYGFFVVEDGVGQLRYDIFDAEAFRLLAVYLAGGDAMLLSPLERRQVVQALRDFAKAYQGRDGPVMLVMRTTVQPARGRYDSYFKKLERIIAKLSAWITPS